MRIGPRKIDLTAMNRHMSMKGILRMRGLKASMPRIVIYELFQNTFQPLSADEIFEKIKVADIVTVHRTLETFERAKLIKNLGKMRKISDPVKKRRTFYQLL
jgi:Fe2+ or Zn2+ uptake regulation protein